MDILRFFCMGLNRLTLRPPDDPELIELARVLRDVAPPLRDMLRNGEGDVRVTYERGRVMMRANTMHFDTVRQLD